MKNMKLFIILLSITAIIIAGTAAYFSVFGLSKLFAGAGISALILFGTLEFGKIVSVSVLYRYWKYFNFFIKTIFTLMVIGIMFITSMGIYGFLRNAYDKTSNEYFIIQKQTKILNQKKIAYNLEINRYQTEIDSKNKQIDTYLNNRSTQEQLISNLYNKSADTNLTSSQSWVYRKRAKETQDGINEYNKQISILREKNTELYQKINILNDSITQIDTKILNIESSDISVEIGPLKYLSDLTNQPMDNVVAFLIFLIIFVFDPFAVLLIIVSNRLSLILENSNQIIENKIEQNKINGQTKNKIDNKIEQNEINEQISENRNNKNEIEQNEISEQISENKNDKNEIEQKNETTENKNNKDKIEQNKISEQISKNKNDKNNEINIEKIDKNDKIDDEIQTINNDINKLESNINLKQNEIDNIENDIVKTKNELINFNKLNDLNKTLSDFNEVINNIDIKNKINTPKNIIRNSHRHNGFTQ